MQVLFSLITKKLQKELKISEMINNVQFSESLVADKGWIYLESNSNIIGYFWIIIPIISDILIIAFFSSDNYRTLREKNITP